MSCKQIYLTLFIRNIMLYDNGVILINDRLESVK